MKRKLFRYLWIITLLASSALACNFFTQVTSRVGPAPETAEALITNVSENQELLATAKAVLTEDGSKLLKTAMSIATQEGPPLLDTAQAFATQQGPA
jgi:hypothetical protein